MHRSLRLPLSIAARHSRAGGNPGISFIPFENRINIACGFIRPVFFRMPVCTVMTKFREKGRKSEQSLLISICV
jgi:hypothetical protein